MPKRVHINDFEFNVSSLINDYHNIQERLNQCCNGTNSAEKSTYEIFKKFIDKDHSCLDIGAYDGVWTTFYMGFLSKKVYALECDPVCVNVFNTNMSHNNFDNVCFNNIAITDKDGYVQFGPRGEFGNSGATTMIQSENATCGRNISKSINVKSNKLETFFKENNINDCNFIKMDIEGGEYNVIPTIKNLLKNKKITLYLSLHHHMCPSIEPILNALIEVYGDKIYNASKDLKKFENLTDILKPYNVHGREILCTFVEV
jgi:FkbM family methyltransferase